MKNKFLTLLFAAIILPCTIMFSACGANNDSNEKYNINFIVNEEVYSTIETSGNEYITLPENPQLGGYEFAGWFFDKDVWQNELKTSTYANKGLTKNVNVFARFKTNVTATINVDVIVDGQKASTVTTNAANYYTIAAPAKPNDITNDPTVKRYFHGWFVDSDCTTPLTGDTKFLKDSQIYAKWIDINENDFEYSVGGNGKITITGYLNTADSIVVVPTYIDSKPVEAIGDGVFTRKTYIKEVIICDGIKEIGKEAFFNCLGILRVTMGDSVIEIKDSAFYCCKNMQSIRLSSNARIIGTKAFDECLSVKCNAYDNAYYIGNEKDKYIVLMKAISKDINSVKIYEGCVFINADAFNGCDYLKSIRIPENVISIDESAFEECDNLANVELSNNVTTIGKSAFQGCSTLTSIIIPSSVTTIADQAFTGCNALAEVYNLSDLNIVKQTLEFGQIGARAKVVHVSLNEKSNLITKNNIVYYQDGTETIALVAIDKTVSTLAIDSSCTTINFAAFYKCQNLSSVTIPKNVTTIEGVAFAYCSNLEYVTFETGSKISAIYESAFANTALKSIIILKSVTTIGSSVFDNCKNLTIYCEYEVQPSTWPLNWDNDATTLWYRETEPAIRDGYWHYLNGLTHEW